MDYPFLKNRLESSDGIFGQSLLYWITAALDHKAIRPPYRRSTRNVTRKLC
jgi:hypothetical protein